MSDEVALSGPEMASFRELPGVEGMFTLVRGLHDYWGAILGIMLSIGIAMATLDTVTGAGFISGNAIMLKIWGAIIAFSSEAAVGAMLFRSAQASKLGSKKQMIVWYAVAILLGLFGIQVLSLFSLEAIGHMTEVQALNWMQFGPVHLDINAWSVERGVVSIVLLFAVLTNLAFRPRNPTPNADAMAKHYADQAAIEQARIQAQTAIQAAKLQSEAALAEHQGTAALAQGELERKKAQANVGGQRAARVIGAAKQAGGSLFGRADQAGSDTPTQPSSGQILGWQYLDNEGEEDDDDPDPTPPPTPGPRRRGRPPVGQGLPPVPATAFGARAASSRGMKNDERIARQHATVAAIKDILRSPVGREMTIRQITDELNAMHARGEFGWHVTYQYVSKIYPLAARALESTDGITVPARKRGRPSGQLRELATA